MKKLFVILALLLISVPAWSATYYVRTDGHDTASGLNNTNDAATGAWLTIKKGAATASAGDTVIINNGTYAEGLVTFSRSGAAGSKISFRAANSRQAQLNGGIKITGSYVRVEGLKIAYASGMTSSPAWAAGSNNEIRNNWIENPRGAGGIRADGSYNVLDGNYITNPQLGIYLAGNNNVAMNNEVSGLTWWGVGFDDADYSRFDGDNHSFINNYYHGGNPVTLGTEHGAHVDCFQTFDNDGTDSRNTTIERNYCSDAHEGIMASAVTRRSSSGLVVRNNVFTRLISWSALAWDYADVHFYNNTVDTTGTYNGLWCQGTNNVSTCEFKNNIIYGSGTFYGVLETAKLIDGTAAAPGKNNLLYRSGSSITGYAGDIKNQNPLFVDRASGNYRLQAASPAIDKGYAISGFSTDLLGAPRSQGAAWDIGAYEFITSSPVNTRVPNPPGNLTID